MPTGYEIPLTGATLVLVLVTGVLFWFPGRMLVWLMGWREARTVIALALSYGISLAALLAARFFGLPVWVPVASGAAVGVVLGAVAFWRHNGNHANLEALKRILSLRPGPGVFLPVTFVVVLSGYLVSLGPWVEIPSDAWWHLGQIQDVYQSISDGRFGMEPDGGLLFKFNGPHWYFFPAVALHLSGLDLAGGLATMAGTYTVLLVCVVYSFALWVFSTVEAGASVRRWMAAASVFFFLMHFGVNVFSFVRYYTFAPVLLNFCVYLAAVVVIKKLLDDPRPGISDLLLLSGFCIVMLLVHRQELMFTIVMGAVMMVVAGVRSNRILLTALWRGEGFIKPARTERRLGMAALALIAAAVALWIWMYNTAPRSNALFNNRLIPLENLLPFVKELYILDPTYQFYEVVTIWGVLVLVAFWLRYRTFLANTFLFAGMLAPLLTVFNPLFIDLFLRVYYAEFVWRLSLMLPLSFVGGYLLVDGFRRLVQGPGWWYRISGGVLALALVVLLAPVSTRYLEERYSRLETVRSVKPVNDHRQWLDLVSFLNTQGPARIITDRVTGYVINGVTGHHYPGFKFFGNGAVPYNLDRYGPDSFNDRDGWLIVVNRRDGGYSRVGKVSKHWPSTIMQVSSHYSVGLLQHLEANPKKFIKLWERDRIAVYRIQVKGVPLHPDANRTGTTESEA